MDSTRYPPQDSEHRREVTASPTPLTANIISNPAPPPQRIESRAKQRCFYAVSIVLLMGVLVANICSFTFFVVIDIEIKSNRSFWETCILFVNQKDPSAGAWSCDAVLGVKSLVMLVTLIMVLLYLILLCRGDPILSGCRFLDTIVFALLAVLSGVVGIILRIGLHYTCTNSDRCNVKNPLDFNTFLAASEYISFGVAVVYLLFFFWALVMLFMYCTCSKQARPPSEERIRLINNQGPNVYSTVRNPFSDTHR